MSRYFGPFFDIGMPLNLYLCCTGTYCQCAILRTYIECVNEPPSAMAQEISGGVGRDHMLEPYTLQLDFHSTPFYLPGHEIPPAVGFTNDEDDDNECHHY
jgi:hypothetical protein